MAFMTSIINALNGVSTWFYELYLDCYYAGWPLSSIAGWFYQFSLIFSNIAWYFYDFSIWVNDVSNKISNYLSWSTIWSYIISYVPNLIQIRDWFYSWATSVTQLITSWWSATQVTVKAWIATAVQPFNDLLTAWNSFWNSLWPQLTSSFNSLKSAWDNFWSYTLPSLVSFSWLTTWWNSRLLEVQGLINSGFTARQGLWTGWQEMRNNVVEFFTDPVEYIWDRFTDWFLGPEG